MELKFGERESRARKTLKITFTEFDGTIS